MGMIRLAQFCLVVPLLLVTDVGSAYETSTHLLLTDTAVDQSVLARGYLEQELGLAMEMFLRSADGKSFRLHDWPGQGSIHEDDFDVSSLAPFRFRHHFYDPVYDRGLTANLGVAVPAGRRAFEWSLESTDGIVGQDFSWRDGRRYFLDALTLRDPADREEAMAQTFRTLGHVLHLIQDMAVPEHTRNDWHAGVFAPFFPFGTPSLFEKRVQALERALPFGAYPLPRFETLQQWWTTSDGRGLAEFTNRNFISQDTNFTQAAEGNTGGDNFGNPYPLPQLSLDQFVELDVTADRAPPCLATAGLAGKVGFYGNRVNDLVTGESIPNDFLTTYSLFDGPLRSKGEPGIFTVKFCTVEAAAGILLPRAIGYSTALIDYFFRGKLEVTFDASSGDADSTTLPLQVMNRSPVPLGPGTLTVYVDDPATGQRNAAAGGTLTLTATVPGDSASAQRLNLGIAAATQPMTLVYQGQLGHEAGAVIGKVYDGMLVEEVFFDGTQWQLRTPTGIFALGLGADVQELKWGDRDNTLLAQTFLSGQGRRLQAYRINRPENSSRIPLVGNIVELAPWRDPVIFTGAIDLGTNLVLSRTTDYAQELATVRGEFSYHFDSTLQDWVQESAVFEPAEVETVFAEVFGGTGAYPLILTANPGPVPYRTFIDDVFLNRDGEVIALVAADNFVLPGPAPGPIFARRRDKAGALVVLEDPRSWLPFSSPDFADLGPVLNVRIWFVVEQMRRPCLG